MSVLPKNETLTNDQTEMLEIKNSIIEVKNELENTGNTVEQMEKSDIKDRNVEMMQREQERLEHKKMKELYENYLPDPIRKSNVRIIGIPEEQVRKKGIENLFKQIVDDNFPSQWKELDPQI